MFRFKEKNLKMTLRNIFFSSMVVSTQDFFLVTQELFHFTQEILPLLPKKLPTPYSKKLRIEKCGYHYRYIQMYTQMHKWLP